MQTGNALVIVCCRGRALRSAERFRFSCHHQILNIVSALSKSSGGSRNLDDRSVFAWWFLRFQTLLHADCEMPENGLSRFVPLPDIAPVLQRATTERSAFRRVALEICSVANIEQLSSPQNTKARLLHLTNCVDAFEKCVALWRDGEFVEQRRRVVCVRICKSPDHPPSMPLVASRLMVWL